MIHGIAIDGDVERRVICNLKSYGSSELSDWSQQRPNVVARRDVKYSMDFPNS